MTRKITSAIITALALIAVAPNARAEIASKDYVDEQKSALITGDTSAWDVPDGVTEAEVIQTAEEQGLAGILVFADSQLQDHGEHIEDLETEIEGKMDTMTVDSTPTANSTNLVTSGGVAAAIASAVSNVDLSTKQDKLGGGNDAGKVVTATGTAGTVSYTGIDTTPTANSTNLVSSGGVATALSDKAPVSRMDNFVGQNRTMEEAVYNVANNAVRKTGQMSNRILVTGNNGSVATAEKLQLAALNFPTPPADCTTKGCMLMFYNGQYVWEPVTRDSGETISTTGSISATQTTPGVTMSVVAGSGEYVCDGPGSAVSGTTCFYQQEL